MKLLCGLLVFVGLLAAINAMPYEDTHVYRFGLLIDAGSSGSRMYIYTWLERTDTGLPDLVTAPINQTQWSYKISPGLSAYANNLDGIPGYLRNLTDFAISKLDPVVVPDTVLYLKATGGLRALSDQDQENIMLRTRAFFRTTPFNFTDSWASVIQLDQEALYGWMTVNYLLKNFQTGAPTVGALDMGGATTEISFIPAVYDPVMLNTSVWLNNRNYNVYTGGYAARGQDTANLLVLQSLAEGVAVGTDVENPCYLVGYSENATVTTSAGTNQYTFVGTGNSTNCRALTRAVLLNTSSCEAVRCGFNGLYQPAVSGRFYAYSGYFYTYDTFFPNDAQNGNRNLREFYQAGDSFCAMSFSDARAAYPKQSLSFLKVYCFTSSYFTQLLSVYGFAADTQDIVFAGVIDNKEVSWALGGMLYEANLLPIIIAPTMAPTTAPTDAPTDAPTTVPTDAPTTAPTPANNATVAPTPANNATIAPTSMPTRGPTPAPVITNSAPAMVLSIFLVAISALVLLM